MVQLRSLTFLCHFYRNSLGHLITRVSHRKLEILSDCSAEVASRELSDCHSWIVGIPLIHKRVTLFLMSVCMDGGSDVNYLILSSVTCRISSYLFRTNWGSNSSSGKSSLPSEFHNFFDKWSIIVIQLSRVYNIMKERVIYV